MYMASSCAVIGYPSKQEGAILRAGNYSLCPTLLLVFWPVSDMVFLSVLFYWCNIVLLFCIPSIQGNGSVVFSKVFQEAGWVAMETTGLKLTSTIQLQTKPETIFTSHNVSSVTVLLTDESSSSWSGNLFLSIIIGCHVFFTVLLFVTPYPLLPCNVHVR